jgi:3-hydroxyacyl-CoA dehydrogenase
LKLFLVHKLHLKYWTLQYGEKFLGKTSVVAKDTPAFIGNRVGIYGIQSLFHLVKEIEQS